MMTNNNDVQFTREDHACGEILRWLYATFRHDFKRYKSHVLDCHVYVAHVVYLFTIHCSSLHRNNDNVAYMHLSSFENICYHQVLDNAIDLGYCADYTAIQ